MSPANILKKPAYYGSVLAGLMLVLLPFHAFLTVWFSSLVGHYTLLRLWKEFLLVLVVLAAKYVLITDKQLRKKTIAFWPARLILIYSIVLLVWSFVPLAMHHTTSKAMWYGLLVNLRFLIFFISVWVLAAKSNFLNDNWQRILFVPAILVAAFAILQYLVLPYDFLKHFGYGDKTIFPYETINHNVNHLRVASTLRGANPLGAYLLLPISALSIFLLKDKAQRRDKVIFGSGLLLALIFSFSRSAWIGLIIALLIICWVLLKTHAKKVLLIGLGAVIVVGAFLAIALRNNSGFENTFLHTERGSKIAQSSNAGHRAAFKSATSDIYHEPLGRGVGTAGPESTYNYGHYGRISENYFLQIGQEAGILGMALFIAICIVVGKLLWEHRADPLALALFASLIGISFINLLSHAWTDDTLAYLWWGLAGLALATPIAKSKR